MGTSPLATDSYTHLIEHVKAVAYLKAEHALAMFVNVAEACSCAVFESEAAVNMGAQSEAAVNMGVQSEAAVNMCSLRQRSTCVWPSPFTSGQLARALPLLLARTSSWAA